MKKYSYFNLFRLVFLLVPSAFSFSNSKIEFASEGVQLNIPTNAKFIIGHVRKLDEDKGSCFDVKSKVGKKFIGEFCFLSRNNGLSSVGIVPYGSIPDIASRGEKPASDLVVTTGASYYPMERFDINFQGAYAAKIDCDLDNGLIYRGTSTCHVGLSKLDNGNFLYGFLVMKQDASKKNVFFASDVKKIWNLFTKI
ncbi:MAG: hypothetical protein K2Q15_06565 [Burkholderiales bacterium]|nr:hypothetical protein [Burkholderiales bacterium]